MKKLTLLAIITFFALSLISCGSNHYSPLDNYINTEAKKAEANAKHLAESQQFIDSINNSK